MSNTQGAGVKWWDHFTSVDFLSCIADETSLLGSVMLVYDSTKFIEKTVHGIPVYLDNYDLGP